MVEEIGESVYVVAVFKEGRITPLLFSWRNRRYDKLTVASVWSDFDGESKRVFFSVMTDRANLYELCFNTRNFNWSLVRIYHD